MFILTGCKRCEYVKFVNASHVIHRICPNCKFEIILEHEGDPWIKFLKARIVNDADLEGLKSAAEYFLIKDFFATPQNYLIRQYMSVEGNNPLLLTWEFLATFGKLKAFSTSYALLFLIPWFVKINNSANIIPYIHLSFPHTLLVSYFGSWCIAIAHTIFSLTCPPLVKDHSSQSKFLYHVEKTPGIPTTTNNRLSIAFWNIIIRKNAVSRIITGFLYFLGFAAMLYVIINNLCVVLRSEL